MKTEWDLSIIYKKESDWNKDFKLLSKKIEEAENLVDSFIKTEESFEDFLNLKIERDTLIEKIYCYAKRHLDLDFKLENYQKMLTEALNLNSKIEIINSIFEKSIIANPEIVKRYVEGSLTYYRRYIYLILRKEKHIKDLDSGENYLIELNHIKQKYQSLISNIDFGSISKGGESIKLDRMNYAKLMDSASEPEKREIFDKYTEGFANICSSLSTLYISKLEKDIEISKREKYPNLLTKKLFNSELSETIVNKLIKSVNDNLKIEHRYLELRKRACNLEEINIYNSNMPLVEIDSSNNDITIDDAITMVKEALSPLGKDYNTLIDKMLNEGWIDFLPREGKRSMSFTSLSYVGVPYILLNFENNINSVRTLAHEIGHSLHAYYSKSHNKFEYFDFGFFQTEIVSKVNEFLFNEYILKRAKTLEEKIFILDNIINGLINSIFNQTLLTEFEHGIITKLENRKKISEKYLNDLYLELNKRYRGKKFTCDDIVKYGWCKIPHLVMQETYYLYQYPICASIATNIVKRILSNEKDFLKKYTNFLSIGNKVDVKSALDSLNIDLEDDEFLAITLKELNSKIDELENLLNS